MNSNNKLRLEKVSFMLIFGNSAPTLSIKKSLLSRKAESWAATPWPKINININ